jgi:hypothetical protein
VPVSVGRCRRSSKWSRTGRVCGSAVGSAGHSLAGPPRPMMGRRVGLRYRPDPHNCWTG